VSPRSGRDRGALAIVLHTHMPYVEGFDTWPFGEEWLWNALIDCYLPLLELLDAGAPLTLSLTPVLCDQLEAAGIGERFTTFIAQTRRAIHADDVEGLRECGQVELARELQRSWESDYERALERFQARGGDVLAALAPHAAWTSAATHAVLPLLATDAGVRLQVRTGLAARRRRFEARLPWRGGFWLPECAHARWLEPILAAAGVRATCVELTAHIAAGAPEHLQPLLADSGLALVPIDRATIALVWSDGGYPAAGVYRDYHHHTHGHNKPWANDGSAYERERACAQAREHAADFVARTLARLSDAAGAAADAGRGLAGGGLAVCALDTELLGHWWYEGLVWLAAVVDECARQGLELVRLDDALTRSEPVAAGGRAAAALERPSTWGLGFDLSTWSGPAVTEMAFGARACELAALAAGAGAGAAAARELLALQASDWPFLVSRELAPSYARERFDGHRRGLRCALSDGPGADTRALRNIAPFADAALLRAP